LGTFSLNFLNNYLEAAMNGEETGGMCPGSARQSATTVSDPDPMLDLNLSGTEQNDFFPFTDSSLESKGNLAAMMSVSMDMGSSFLEGPISI
jgi:hypothetical protein